MATQRKCTVASKLTAGEPLEQVSSRWWAGVSFRRAPARHASSRRPGNRGGCSSTRVHAAAAAAAVAAHAVSRTHACTRALDIRYATAWRRDGAPATDGVGVGGGTNSAEAPCDGRQQTPMLLEAAVTEASSGGR